MIALITGWGLRFNVPLARNVTFAPDMTVTGINELLAVSREHWQEDDYIFHWPAFLRRDAAGLRGSHALDLTNPREAAIYDAVVNGRMFWSTGPDGTPTAAAARRRAMMANPPTRPTGQKIARRRHIAELAYTTHPADHSMPALTVAAVLPHQDPPARILIPVLYALWAIGESPHERKRIQPTISRA